MAELFDSKLLDSTSNMVYAVPNIDALEAIKNAPGRYSIVAWAAASVPSGQRAVVQGGPGAWTLAHLDSWSGGPRR